MTRAARLAAAAVLFAVAATANSGGYRYGVSDQAFYATAVVKDLHPSYFPRDTPLIETQARLMLSDEVIAAIVRVTGIDLPAVSLWMYAATLVVLFAGAVAFARASGYSWWAAALLLVLLTFRHRIAKTGANSLEGYMHPRELAFGFGLLAFAALLQLRTRLAILFVAIAACWHPTTAFWFAIVGGVTIGMSPEWRRPAIVLCAAGIVIAVWAVLKGPFAGQLARMDDAWLGVLAEKDYLFPHQWPLYAWIANLAYPLVIVVLYRQRERQGVAATGERAFVVGLLVLVACFLLVLPLTIMRVALAVQMQVTRVFWLLDFAAAAYVAWWLMDDRSRGRRWVRAAIAGVLIAVSAGRGYYLVGRAESGRSLIARDLPGTPWVDAMRWLRSQPPGWHVLADPGHAWKYGVSVRLAAEKDTMIESGKDTALAMYDRRIAMRVADRLAALSGFDRLTPEAARDLAARYDLDVLVIEKTHPFDLPELYSNTAFTIYRLR